MMKKKKTRSGKARHPMQTQDAKMMSKNEDEKKDYAHIKCFKQFMRGKAIRSTT